jgi:hypothetical protein
LFFRDGALAVEGLIIRISIDGCSGLLPAGT